MEAFKKKLNSCLAYKFLLLAVFSQSWADMAILPATIAICFIISIYHLFLRTISAEMGSPSMELYVPGIS